MRLILQLIVRLLAVVLLCLGAATIWAMFDAYRSVDRATAASAERVSQALEALYWRELLLRSSRTREHLLPVPEWRTVETMKLISPGVCIQLLPKTEFEKSHIHDIHVPEYLAWAPMLVLIVILGILPSAMFRVTDGAVQKIAAPVQAIGR